jgi:hypothetical protein
VQDCIRDVWPVSASIEQDLLRGRALEAADLDSDVVRSQVTGTLLVTDAPAVRVATMLLGFSWQSVDVHQTSDPLDTVSL